MSDEYDELVRAMSLGERVLPDGRTLSAYRLLFNRARIQIFTPGDLFADEEW